MKKTIKQELGYFILFDYLESVRTACSGALSSDETLNGAFNTLSERCAELVQTGYCGNITEQYVITICEEEEET